MNILCSGQTSCNNGYGGVSYEDGILPNKGEKVSHKQETRCLVCKMIGACTEGQIMGDLP